MAERFPDCPEALENTAWIAERCELELDFTRTLLPAFPLPAGCDSLEALLEAEARRGLERRYGSIDEAVLERFEYELDVIQRTGYAGYFLIVADFIAHARANGITVGPGRGSAAGSLVAYCLGITNIDPLRYGLLFERFLNPERVSMPDIDIDFCERRRALTRQVDPRMRVLTRAHAGRRIDDDNGARMPRPELKPENLSELVRQAVFLERNRNPGLKFDLTLPESDIILICDSRQIAQVLTNLLKNASEAIEENRGENGMADREGIVWVTVNREAPEGEAERVAIVVADNGRGLPVDCRDRLTEPYVTSRVKGTGLGLAIVKKITEDHNADLIFEDRENGGARVKVIFHGMEGRLNLDDKSTVRSVVAQSPRSGAM